MAIRRFIRLSHHLINGLPLSLFFEVGQCDHIVTADRANLPPASDYPAPGVHSARLF